LFRLSISWIPLFLLFTFRVLKNTFHPLYRVGCNCVRCCTVFIITLCIPERY
jgi:hypothetical protein